MEKTVLNLRVIPNASKSEVVGEIAGKWKVKVPTPPENGRANTAVIEFLAKILGLSVGAIQLLSGEKSREKRLQIEGLNTTAVLEKLKKACR